MVARATRLARQRRRIARSPSCTVQGEIVASAIAHGRRDVDECRRGRSCHAARGRVRSNPVATTRRRRSGRRRRRSAPERHGHRRPGLLRRRGARTASRSIGRRSRRPASRPSAARPWSCRGPTARRSSRPDSGPGRPSTWPRSAMRRLPSRWPPSATNGPRGRSDWPGGVDAATAGQAVVEGVLLARYRYRVFRDIPNEAHLRGLTIVVERSRGLGAVRDGRDTRRGDRPGGQPRSRPRATRPPPT